LGSCHQQAELLTERAVALVQRDLGRWREINGQIDVDPDFTRPDAHSALHRP
jgi:hypothetical protein